MNNKRTYAIIGTGSRATLYINALTGPFSPSSTLVALCDTSHTRMRWHNQQLASAGIPPIPAFHASDFDAMIHQSRPDAIIISTIDSQHHHYIARGLSLGCDIICEKPLATTLPNLLTIDSAIKQSSRSLRIAFNYRYAPAFSRFRQLIIDGTIGKPLAIDFSWLLDTSHGADYFRRWHREKSNSGGLLVHKASHHFDLVNWWIDSFPQQVFAFGDLLFYGKSNAQARGESYPYDRYTGHPAAKDDPFALFLDKNNALRGLYLDAENETGYIRDQNVFSDNITIEDTMTLVARYDSGALLSYNLTAFGPWEGLSVAITGTKGRLEMDIIETPSHLHADQTSAAASKGPFKQTQIRAFPIFGQPREIDVPHAQGGHGGADPLMLRDLFSTNPTAPDPLRRAAGPIDGAASALLGIAANLSMARRQMIHIPDLYDLSRLPRQ